jgi:ABC-type branched-subunit amino acid transport system substrate-binding protein
MREKIAIVFMTLSAVATLVLGGAVIHEWGRSDQVQQTATTNAPGIQSSTGTQGSQGTQGTQGTQGHTISASGGGQTPNLSSAGEGVSRGLITVGGIYDETGPFDATVERDTVRAYFNMINAQGGVNGYKFQLLDCDSAYDPTQAHQCSQRLVGQGILAMVGWLSVSGENPETPYLTQQGVPIIGGLGVPTEFQSPISYPTTASLVRYGTAMGTHAKDLNVHSPGVIVLNANFIKPVEDALVAALKKQGINPVAVDEVDPTKADYTDEVLKIKNAGADSIIAGLDPFSYQRLFQAMDRQAWYPKVMGLGLDKQSANKDYGRPADGAESLTPLLEPADHTSQPAIKTYYDAVRRYFPNQVDALDVYTEGDWVAAQVFVEAIRRLGDKPVNRKSLVESLNTIKNFDTGGLTEPLSYSAGNSHDPNKCFQWIRKQSNVWTTYSGWKCF